MMLLNRIGAPQGTSLYTSFAHFLSAPSGAPWDKGLRAADGPKSRFDAFQITPFKSLIFKDLMRCV